MTRDGFMVLVNLLLSWSHGGCNLKSNTRTQHVEITRHLKKLFKRYGGKKP